MPSTGIVRILVGFDGSDDSLAALDYAAKEALARAGELHVVYAVDDTVLNSAWGLVFDVDAVRQAGLDLLARAREYAHERGVPSDVISTETVLGQPGAVLCKLSEGASLLVVGRRAESGEKSMFVGSTAVAVAGTAACPVILASALNQVDAKPTGVIGVGMDNTGRGAVAVEWAAKRAARTDATVRVISIVQPPSGRFFGAGRLTAAQKTQAIEGVRTRLEAVVESVRQNTDATIELVVGFGSVVEELVAASDHLDLLILGVHPGFPTYSIGGKIRGLMTHSRCPLGLVRHK